MEAVKITQAKSYDICLRKLGFRPIYVYSIQTIYIPQTDSQEDNYKVYDITVKLDKGS